MTSAVDTHPDTQHRSGDTTPRWGMVIDLNRCVGCQTCTIACKQANDTPPGVQWRQVHDVERGTYPDVERFFLVAGCQHCADPPCVPVCPTGATAQRADGLVTMDYDTCIGCGYCAVACPYQARTIVHDKEWYYGSPTVQEERDYPDDRLGVATKCTFCVERVDDATAAGVSPGADPVHTPACAASCIAEAINFGDFNDPGSTVSRLAAEEPNFQMHADLGTDPQIRYLYKGADSETAMDAAAGGHHQSTSPDNPLVGVRQRFWDERAAMNFTMGGMSTGLAIFAYLAHLTAGLGAQALLWLQLSAAVGMAIGLFFVFLEIGRKLRFLYVLKRPQSSWMTRETYFVALFYPAVVIDFLWPHWVLHLIVALAAAGFLYCQARILHAGKGIPAWRHPLMPLMLVATGLLEGAGLLTIAGAISPSSVGLGWPLYAAGIALAAIGALLWWHYMVTAQRRGIGEQARRVLTRLSPFLYVVGYLTPIVLFALALGIPDAASMLAGLGGLAAVVGGVAWKFTVITRACHQQGFAVPSPVRANGGAAASASVS